MAEKEERIYVRKYSEDNPCNACEDKNGDECDFCMKNYEWNASISRQEAIERIEKVLEEGWWSGKTFRQLSEAALNALLSKVE